MSSSKGAVKYPDFRPIGQIELSSSDRIIRRKGRRFGQTPQFILYELVTQRIFRGITESTFHPDIDQMYYDRYPFPRRFLQDGIVEFYDPITHKTDESGVDATGIDRITTVILRDFAELWQQFFLYNRELHG